MSYSPKSSPVPFAVPLASPARFRFDEEALEALRAPLRDYLRRRGVRGPELDDLVQTALLRVWGSRHRLDPARDPRHYALRTAENLVRDRRPLPLVLSLDAPTFGDGPPMVERLADPTDPYLDVVHGRTDSPISAGLRGLLARLPEMDRATLLLYAEGLPREKAAARAGISLAAYGARLYRAQQRVRELLPTLAETL